MIVIPLPRAWLLTSALLLGCVAGQIAAVVAKLTVHATIRPDIVVALVIAAGAFVLAMAPGWLSVLLLLQVVSE
jgi:hypothetical protein